MGQKDFRGLQMNMSVCWRSLYERANAKSESATSIRTRTVTGRADARGLRLRVSALIACFATAAASDIIAYRHSGEIRAERAKHPPLRPSRIRKLIGMNAMSLEVKEAFGTRQILYGPSQDSAGHRFGVRHQVCHFDERYHTSASHWT